MSLILDAGALIAWERGSRLALAFLMSAADSGETVKTSTAVIAQVWRHGSRQAALARLLRGVEEVPLTPQRARAIGALLGRARGADVVDAALVELAAGGDEILTSDPGDLLRLANHSGKTLIVTPVG
ncbi:MAG TPA: PIN domain-containing protein [Polyangia bacterium]